MSRPVRIVLAALLVLAALVGLAGTLSQTVQTFYLPSSQGPANENTALFGPAVVAAVIVALLVIALIVHLVLAIRRPSRGWVWAVAIVLAAIALAIPFLVSTMQRPVF
ncbi:hypothetical protein [Microbacterium sp. 22242]|uniref:hypothetical protein n=1 Tax=Microbacterium sp. 22242 TaxID=3453896 RepID=UPI003F82B945